MMTRTILGLGSLLALSLTVLALNGRPAAVSAMSVSSFSGVTEGDLTSLFSGHATYGVVDGQGQAPDAFTLSLGATGDEGSVLFTRTSGGRLVPGTYVITGREDGTDEVRALVMTGSAMQPTGVFRAESGTLVITSVEDNVIRGTYRLQALGFVASAPQLENRRIRATGGFTATRS
jgi:hypothetical protein